MNYVFVIGSALLLIFSFVILYGAPYLPTLRNQTDVALKLLDLKKGQTLVELGSGDGRILKAAAKQGIRGIGYELNPLLVIFSRISCFRYRKMVRFHCRNYWHITLPQCDGIYVFLLDRFMPKLDAKIKAELKPPIKLVSYAFKIPKKKVDREKDALFLYKY